MDGSSLRIMGDIVQILYQLLPVRLGRDQASVLGHLRPILGGHNLQGKWLQINIFSANVPADVDKSSQPIN